MAAAQKRVRVLSDVVTPRLVEATSEIVVAKHGAHDERLRPKGVSNTLDPSPTLRPTKLVPENLPELIPSLSPVPASDAAPNPHVVVQLARRCWDGWLRKHRALTNSEGVYASLLTDARRCDILTDELSMVNDILSKQRACETDALAGIDSSGSSADRASAHDGLRALIVAKAQEAIAGYKERTNNYHCGHTCKLTGFLRISRSPGDMDDTLRLFEGRVGAETEEALDQAQEVIVAPDLKILSETLSRRVEFWESEVEKSWVCWTAHSSEFHEACEAIAEDWREFHAQMLEVVARVQEAPTPSNSTSTIMFIMPALNMQEVQAQKRWEEMHQVLVTAAEVLALLGAWTDHHNLRGDGLALSQAACLFRDIVKLLESRFGGSSAVQKGLESNSAWRVVATAAEAAADGDAVLWWCPRFWRHPLFTALCVTSACWLHSEDSPDRKSVV